MRWFFGILLLIGGGIGAYFAISTVLWQQRANQDFVAVDADILSAKVQISSGKHTSYAPAITYRYTYKGVLYNSSRVLTISQSAGNSWASGIVARYSAPVFRPGAINHRYATAYIDRDNPSDSILVREYFFPPYGLVMVAVFVAEIGAGLLAGVLGGGISKMSTLALDDSGWKLLLPTKNLRKQFRDSVVRLCGASLAFVPPLLHWIFVAGNHDIGTILFAAFVAAILILMIIQVFNRWSVSRHMSDVRLRLKPAPMLRGAPVEIEIEADAYSALRVNKVVCNVICTEHYKERSGNKTSYGTRTSEDTKINLAEACEISAGQVLAGKGHAQILGGVPTTSKRTVKTYPYYTWEIRLAVDLEKMVDYRAVFPLEAV